MPKTKHYFAVVSFFAFAAIAMFSVYGLQSNNAFRDKSQFPSEKFYYVMLLETFGYASVFIGFVVYLITNIPGIGCVIEQLPCITVLKVVTAIGALTWSIGTYYLYKLYEDNKIKELYNTSKLLGILAYIQLVFPILYSFMCLVVACYSCCKKKNKKLDSKYDEI